MVVVDVVFVEVEEEKVVGSVEDGGFRSCTMWLFK